MSKENDFILAILDLNKDFGFQDYELANLFQNIIAHLFPLDMDEEDLRMYIKSSYNLYNKILEIRKKTHAKDKERMRW